MKAQTPQFCVSVGKFYRALSDLLTWRAQVSSGSEGQTIELVIAPEGWYLGAVAANGVSVVIAPLPGTPSGPSPSWTVVVSLAVSEVLPVYRALRDALGVWDLQLEFHEKRQEVVFRWGGHAYRAARQRGPDLRRVLPVISSFTLLPALKVVVPREQWLQALDPSRETASHCFVVERFVPGVCTIAGARSLEIEARGWQWSVNLHVCALWAFLSTLEESQLLVYAYRLDDSGGYVVQAGIPRYWYYESFVGASQLESVGKHE